jgi:hypothetical protein
MVRAGHSSQFDATIFDLGRLHLLGAMGRQAILQVDAGQRRRKLPQIGRRRSDQARELTEAPMGRRDWRIRAGQHQRQALCVDWLPPGSPRSRRYGCGFARSVHARRHRGRTGKGSARRRASKTIRRTRGRSARRGSHPPCSRRRGRERCPESPHGSWLVSMTGAGGLSSSPQPVTEIRSALSLSGRCRQAVRKTDQEMARPRRCLVSRPPEVAWGCAGTCQGFTNR